MTMCPIDTMKVMDKLTTAGVPEQQARAHTAVLVDLLQSQEAHIMTNACTKDDLKAALAPIESRLGALEKKVAELEVTFPAAMAESVAKLKSELLTWIVGLGLLQGGLITGLIVRVVPGAS